MNRVFSGIQPTGEMHLGNYLGAVRRWVSEAPISPENRSEALYCVVDLHAMTVPYEPVEFAERTRRTAMLLLAAGLDPERCVLFVQSHVSAHTELTWILNCIATYGELRRMTQFKDKGQGQESVSVGLLDYPVLMAADILAYDTTEVPIGDDQRQHLELARDIAIRFNHRFGETLIVPKPTFPEVAARVKDLQNPSAKMSKSANSEAGQILLVDPPSRIAKKIKSAVTDSLAVINYDPINQPGVSNLLEILSAATDRTVEQTALELEGQGYGALKSQTADAVVALIEPLQMRLAELESDLDEVGRVLAAGAERAQEIAVPVMERVRSATGLLPRLT
ncbi:MAG: tryptophan--tRNA ligase [Actinobacteria bacterium]|uniref:tryptophan--tRNA ligase n=1 Tax=freshwater metagenome TaxID=449393 RepID=A0A6J7QGP2_9ZZZZ|nr:tryptophan--tRNA ligase [Actinomycetota bacterium]MSX32265.1 tryptophan--tRNA ligase [Actinomycetota bacterium]MSX81586.1 tryptophan--tRNA ligase [Actinomycetota bacterium]MSY06103.1 tryptophan--tRNA ligase [Actinomycetota bacterium]MSZ29624.1 tryptophan--tRNA ligase [Actinomycetota bacterium]